ncbi:hypothetical protein D3C73_1367080 [compost metagenome]
MAVELFAAFGKQGLEVLQDHLNDMDADVRLFVVQAMVQLPYKDEVNRLLIKQLHIDKEANVVVAMIEALGDLGGGEAEAEAIRYAMGQFEHPYIDYVGQRALRRLGHGPSQSKESL